MQTMHNMQSFFIEKPDRWAIGQFIGKCVMKNIVKVYRISKFLAKILSSSLLSFTMFFASTMTTS